jgi:hypothetical protein
MKRALTALTLLTLSSTAAYAAGLYQDEAISDIVIYTPASGQGVTSGFAVVVFGINGTGTPECSRLFKNSLIIDLSTPGGLEAYKFLNAAYNMGKMVTADGTGSCSIKSQVETLADVHYATPPGAAK